MGHQKKNEAECCYYEPPQSDAKSKSNARTSWNCFRRQKKAKEPSGKSHKKNMRCANEYDIPIWLRPHLPVCAGCKLANKSIHENQEMRSFSNVTGDLQKAASTKEPSTGCFAVKVPKNGAERL